MSTASAAYPIGTPWGAAVRGTACGDRLCAVSRKTGTEMAYTRGGSDECPGQDPRNLISLLHLNFPYIDCTKLTNQLLCGLNIVGF